MVDGTLKLHVSMYWCKSSPIISGFLPSTKSNGIVAGSLRLSMIVIFVVPIAICASEHISAHMCMYHSGFPPSESYCPSHHTESLRCRLRRLNAMLLRQGSGWGKHPSLLITFQKSDGPFLRSSWPTLGFLSKFGEFVSPSEIFSVHFSLYLNQFSYNPHDLHLVFAFKSSNLDCLPASFSSSMS